MAPMPETSFALVKAVLTLLVLGAFIAFMIIDHRRNLPTPRATASGEGKSKAGNQPPRSEPGRLASESPATEDPPAG